MTDIITDTVAGIAVAILIPLAFTCFWVAWALTVKGLDGEKG